MIVLVFTGGTIAMRHDPLAGGAVPSLSAGDIIAATPGLSAIADVRVEEWGAFPGPHMTVARMWTLRNRLVDLVTDPAVDGVVVTHGTDTLEETAYLIARSVPPAKPIVFTGAMRAAGELGWDGPANLLAAARVASNPQARGYGAVIATNDRVFAGSEVTKSHTHVLDAFESPGFGPLASLDDGKVIFHRELAPPAPLLSPAELADPVDIVAAWPGADARLIDASRQTARGIVVAALGRGNVPPSMADGIVRAVDGDVPVVITSRASRGRVGQTCAYAGGGRRLADAGALFGGARRPQQARIDLLLALGCGLAGDALRQVFAQ